MGGHFFGAICRCAYDTFFFPPRDQQKMIGISQLLSSKKASRPTAAPSKQQQSSQPPMIPPPSSSAEVLQLRLDNSDLRRRLEDALSHTDESKLELLHLLDEQTLQTNHLQSKCDELAAGFVEIDKERRLLRKSADDMRKGATHEVEKVKIECDTQCKELEKHIKMKEKEVETLAERTREQERRIEDVVSENKDRQSKVEDLDGELEELINMIESEREERKKLIVEHEKSMLAVRMELQKTKLAETSLDGRVKELQQSLQEKETTFRLQEEMTTKDLQCNEAEAVKLLKDQQSMKIDLDAKNDIIKTLQSEQKQIVHLLQSKINEQSSTIHTLNSDIDQLESTQTLKMIELEALVMESKLETRGIELNYQQSREITTQLQGELEHLRSTQQIAHEELKATIYLLEKEKGELTDKVTHLTETKGRLANFEAEHVTLQTEHTSLRQLYTEQKQQLSTLEDQMERMSGESNEEKNVSNQLRSHLRELNIQIKKDGSARQNEKLALERDIRTRQEADISSMRNEHAEQIMLIENSGADILNDLEDVIDALKKEVADGTLEHTKTIHELKSEKERVVRTMSEQQEKIGKLTVYAKERKEEARELEDAISVIRDKLQIAQASHERDVYDLQVTIDSLQSELASTREQLSTEDEELERAKATLSERTNLLRNMVNQTKSYQGDYKRENARANSLEEAVAKYKRKSNDALTANQCLEQEIHEKDSQYCDAIGIERHQRKTMEAELESVRKSMEDVLRKYAEVEKHAEMLRDKVSRQESYIGRLLDREKQSRRTSVVGVGSSRSQMIAARPSTADVVRPALPKCHRRKQPSNGTKENDRPNSSREFS